jgi:2'-5' RNA ligase
MRLSLGLRVPRPSFDQLQFQKLLTGLKNFPDSEMESLDHLTIPLIHLGEMGHGTFMGIYHDLKNVALEHQGLSLTLQGLWAYPHQTEADMLWIGVQNSRDLRGLQEALVHYLVLDEKNILRPHIPLVHLPRPVDVTDLISPFKNFDFGDVEIGEIVFTEKRPRQHSERFVASYKLQT